MRKSLVAAVVAAITMVAAVLVATADTTVRGGGVVSLHCKFSHLNTDDAIVFPAQPGAAHLHGYVGARDTNAFSTVETQLAAASSCPVTGDTAGYWFPVLVKGGVVKPPNQVNVYYRSPSGRAVQPYPTGLKMLAGGDTQNPPKPSMVQNSLSWSCKDSGPFSATIPDCGDRAAIAHVHFQDCWDGANLDSPDHRGHLAYSSGKDCPSSHPVQLPRLSLHIRYKIGDPTGYTLSSDAGAGFNQPGRSLHADFWATWDPATFAFLVKTCLDTGLSCKGLTDTKLANLGFA